jgi:hypothetical protein
MTVGHCAIYGAAFVEVIQHQVCTGYYSYVPSLFNLHQTI